jgi:hypothetical protein
MFVDSNSQRGTCKPPSFKILALTAYHEASCHLFQAFGTGGKDLSGNLIHVKMHAAFTLDRGFYLANYAG